MYVNYHSLTNINTSNMKGKNMNLRSLIQCLCFWKLCH